MGLKTSKRVLSTGEEKKRKYSLLKDPRIPDEQGQLSPTKATVQHLIQMAEKSNG